MIAYQLILNEHADALKDATDVRYFCTAEKAMQFLGDGFRTRNAMPVTTRVLENMATLFRYETIMKPANSTVFMGAVIVTHDVFCHFCAIEIE